MSIKHTIQTALAGLSANKGRSFLTILGIVIGIMAIIVMVSMGTSAERLIVSEVSGLGAETVVIRPGQEPEGPSDVGSTLFADSLKKRDIELLERKENAPEIVEVMPALVVPESISYEGETYTPQLFGGDAEFFSEAFGTFPSEGRFFDDQEIRDLAHVAVLGSKVKDELFGNANAVGQFVRIKDRKFRVVGVLAPKGQVSFFNFDEVVMIPHTTAQTYLLGIDYYHEVIVKTTGPEAVARTVRDIEATLRAAHGITDPDKDDFFVVTQQGVVDQVRSILGALTVFLSSVVAIGLLVGGIGIMNIMLVSVTERTREIGLRKAVGATYHDILRQFLFEAVILTGIGGVIGVALGGAISYATAFVLTTFFNLDWAFSFPLSATLLGVGMSAIVGLIFGIYPARKAARKSPIEALRYE